MSHPQAMLDKATDVMKNAYSPYSNFQVGACIRTKDDQFFIGCNIENASYPLTLCAEASAIAQMISEGANDITEIAIASSGNQFCVPCGACRQRLAEFSTLDAPIHMSDNNGNIKTVRLGELFPQPFNLDNVRGNP